MRDKKMNTVFWIIGLGCGIILSGIFMLVIVLNIQPVQLEDVANREILVANPVPSQVEAEDQKENQKELPKEEIESQGQPEKEIKEKVTVKIPANASSDAISKLLEEKGVIEDKKAFNKYIFENKKSTRLRAGTWEFPILGEYAEVLDILIYGN